MPRTLVAFFFVSSSNIFLDPSPTIEVAWKIFVLMAQAKNTHLPSIVASSFLHSPNPLPPQKFSYFSASFQHCIRHDEYARFIMARIRPKATCLEVLHAVGDSREDDVKKSY